MSRDVTGKVVIKLFSENVVLCSKIQLTTSSF